MGRRSRNPARHYQFWRRAFWVRPAFLTLYAVLCGVAGLVAVIAVPGSYQDGEAMERARVCRTAADMDCLEPVPGYLDGPHYKRRAGDRWYLRDGDELAQGFDGFTMATAPSQTLEDVGPDTVVTGLVWDDEIVAVQLPDGRRVATDDYGTSRWWTLLLMALLGVGVAPFLLSLALARRHQVGGWWGVRAGSGPHGAEPPDPGRLMGVCVALMVPAGFGLLPIMFLGSVTLSMVAAAVGLAVAGYAAVRIWRGASAQAHEALRD